MDLGLDGAVVLVTGGSMGLGKALARRLLDEGARVAICGRGADALAVAEAELAGPGRELLAVPADVTSPDDATRLIDTVVARWGGLDGLVNNAGTASGGPFEANGDDAWAADFELKVHGANRLTRLALPHLRASDRASIIHVLAIAAKSPGAGSLPSAAARAAGLAIAKSLAKELGPAGIRVNAILIGTIESGQWERRAAASGQPLEELYAAMARSASIPLGRVGRAEEFADLAAYLLSRRASFVTGVGINCDGGASPVW